jgi:mono/diheme cytochrome c family protein
MKVTWNKGKAVSLLVVVGLAVIGVVAAPALAASEAEPRGEVTFAKDIAPILQRSCQKCHRPNSLAPMSLIDYEEVRPWARTMKYRTGLRDKRGVMPPWYIEKNIGIQQFKSDPSLSDEEIAKIAAWADNGAPRGDPADMPPPVAFIDADEWEIGQPDLIVSSPSINVKAEAPDWWGPIGESPTGLTEDRYVAAVEYKEVTESRKGPGRKTVGGLFVVHHSTMGVIDPDADEAEQEVARLGGWPVHEVGRNVDVFGPEAGRLLPAGSKLVFPNVHLHANGAETKAHLEVGFKFHPRGYKPTLKEQGISWASVDLDIEAMDPDQQVEIYFTVPEHLRMTTFEPHMHAPGVRMCLEAIWGQMRETLNCAGYDHSWVRVYTYADDAAPLLPKGTILRLIGYFNNSPSNPNVPDPRNWSGSGNRSVDQMFINLARGIYLTEQQFREELAARRERLGLKVGDTVVGCPLCGLGDRPAAASGDK